MNPIMAWTGGRAPPSQNMPMLYVGSRWLAAAHDSPVPELSSSPQRLWEPRHQSPDRSLVASPIHEALARCSRSWMPPNIPPPIVTYAPRHVLTPSAPLGPGPRAKTSLPSLSSWLHLLKC